MKNIASKLAFDRRQIIALNMPHFEKGCVQNSEVKSPTMALGHKQKNQNISTYIV